MVPCRKPLCPYPVSRPVEGPPTLLDFCDGDLATYGRHLARDGAVRALRAFSCVACRHVTVVPFGSAPVMTCWSCGRLVYPAPRCAA